MKNIFKYMSISLQNLYQSRIIQRELIDKIDIFVLFVYEILREAVKMSSVEHSIEC
jgi:hypothetical protein